LITGTISFGRETLTDRIGAVATMLPSGSPSAAAT
jgi:hypothetical protein